MKNIDLFNALNSIDEQLVLDAAPSDKASTKNKAAVQNRFFKRFTIIAACFVLVAVCVFTVFSLREPNYSSGSTDIGNCNGAQGVKPPQGTGDSYGGADGSGSIINISNVKWTYNGTINGKEQYSYTTAYKYPVTLNISFGEAVNEHSASSDPCMILYGQYLSTLYSLDYTAHFALFPEQLVENTFTNEIGGLTYEQGIENIEKASEFILFLNDFDFSYKIDKTETAMPNTLHFEEIISSGYFEDSGIDASAVEEIRIYYFSEFVLTIGGVYTQYGDPGINTDDGLKFFKINGTWYIWPSHIDDDLSVDLAQAEHETSSWYKLSTISGVIEAIDGDYISLGGNKRFFAPQYVKDYKVGDTVTIQYAKSGSAPIKTEQGKLNLYALHSIAMS